MADVMVGVSREKGVVAILLQWRDDRDPCTAKSPSGIECQLPLDHDQQWHIGFPAQQYGMPVRWRNDDYQPGNW